jgi:hypothetical protein
MTSCGHVVTKDAQIWSPQGECRRDMPMARAASSKRASLPSSAMPMAVAVSHCDFSHPKHGPDNGTDVDLHKSEL